MPRYEFAGDCACAIGLDLNRQGQGPIIDHDGEDDIK
jgi:hypothetical protein